MNDGAIVVLGLIGCLSICMICATVAYVATVRGEK